MFPCPHACMIPNAQQKFNQQENISNPHLPPIKPAANAAPGAKKLIAARIGRGAINEWDNSSNARIDHSGIPQYSRFDESLAVKCSGFAPQ